MKQSERKEQSRQDKKQGERLRTQKVTEPFLDALHAVEADILRVGETAFHPRADRHRALLSQPCSDARRSNIVLHLQRTYGNSYVQRLLNSVAVQAKMTVNASDDIYEQEADRVADTVSRAISSRAQRQQRQPEEEEELQPKPASEIQRQEEEEELQMQQIEEEEEQLQMKAAPEVQRQERELIHERDAAIHDQVVSQGLEATIDRAQGGGQPLPESVRASFEPQFDRDFSGVRVHTDAEADTLSHQLQAKAFTTGKDIFFRKDAYQPDADEGKGLLAHELTHVVQQTEAQATWTKKATPVSETLLRGAEASGATARSADTSVVAQSETAATVARDEMEGQGRTGTAPREGAAPEARYRVTIAGEEVYLTEEQYNREVAQATKTIRRTVFLIRGYNDAGRQTHRWFMKEVHNWVGVISDILGRVSPPSVEMWDLTDILLDGAEAALDSDNLEFATDRVRRAEIRYNEAQKAWYEYREGTIGGAGRAVKALEITRDVSFTAAGALAAPALLPAGAGFLATTGVGVTAAGAFKGVEEVATQSSEMWHGLRGEFDYGQLFRNMSTSAITSLAGGLVSGAIGKVFFPRLLQGIQPAVLEKLSAEIGEPLTAQMFETVGQKLTREFLEGAGKALIGEAIKAVAEAPTAGERITTEVFAERVAGEFLKGEGGDALADFLCERIGAAAK